MEGQSAMTQKSFFISYCSLSDTLTTGSDLYDFDVGGVDDIAQRFVICESDLEGHWT